MGKRRIGCSKKWKEAKKMKENVWRDDCGIKRENSIFEDYYRIQRIVPEEEFEEFMDYLRRDLPLTFRINECDPNNGAIKELLKTRYHFEGTVEYEGQQLCAVHAIPWYENEGAWQIDVSRKKLRKIAAFQDLHAFLVQATLSGEIGRQEAVSMLPPLFLDVKEDEIILDMCAAPGSKTLQVLEKVHHHGGVIIANDADGSRACMLVNQTNHIRSTNIMITSQLGQLFPLLLDERGNAVFDKIICDVPCSGDGTFRKALELWTSWSIKYSLSLHSLQCSLLLHGLRLLKKGGRLVYSTCSMNPIEDEAVILHVLSLCKGSVHIVNCNDVLPLLNRSGGMCEWKVVDEENTVYSSYDTIPEKRKKSYKPSMFPPPIEFCQNAHIEWAMRFLPHQNNSGGFFVCLLEKTELISVKDEEMEDGEAIRIGNELIGVVKEEQRMLSNRMLSNNKRSEPLIKWDMKGKESIQSFYGIDDSFNWDLIYTRSENNHSLVCVHPTIDRVCLQSSYSQELQMIHTGLKVFEFNNHRGDCDYRLCQEGLFLLKPYITKRINRISATDFSIMLNTQKSPGSFDLFSPSLQEWIEKTSVGTCVFGLDSSTVQQLSNKQPSHHQYYQDTGIVVWRGTKNVSILVNENEIKKMKRLLYLE